MPVPLPWMHKKYPEAQLTIDYKGTQFNDITFATIRTAVINLRIAAARVSGALAGAGNRGALSGKVAAAFAKYFEITGPATPADFTKVVNKCQKISQGVNAPLTLAAIVRWRGGNTGTQGYVRGTEGRIHISLSEYGGGSNVEQQVIILHEASHKFANTDDWAYWQKNSGTWDIQQAPFDTANACRNADSYGYFIQEAARI